MTIAHRDVSFGCEVLRPERFEPVPLPTPLLGDKAGGLWAWAPVPRSIYFLSLGLVFTAVPEPPSVNDVRCVGRWLVEDAEPHGYKVRIDRI